MRLLALDMSTSVGWIAFGKPGLVLDINTWHVPMRSSLGARFLAFDGWLADRIAKVKPDALAFEEPIRPRFGSKLKTTDSTVKLLQGLAAVAELVGARCNVARVLEVPGASAKLKLAGNGRAKKPAMIAAAIAMGVAVGTEHEADALAVGMCAYEHLGFEARGYAGPLLADQARW